jgi:hypothetical protein
LIKPDLRADFHIGRILGVRDQQGTICAIALDGIGSLIGQAATTRLEGGSKLRCDFAPPTSWR